MRQVVFYSAAVLLAAAVCVTASGPVLIDECHEAFIPTDLDLITTVEQTEYRETHLHGEYRIGSDDFVADLGGMVRNLTLKYDAPTQFRMSVSPVDADYLALRLIRIADDGTETVVSHSRHGGERIERMVFGLLDSNVKYHVMIVYSLGLNSQIKCPKVLVEMAAQPVDQMTHFFDSCSSAQDPIIIPSITPTSDNKWYYEWTSNPLFVYLGGDTASVTAPPSAGPPPRHNYGDEHFSVVGYYPVTVPFIPGHHSKFKLRALIHANFIDGGDVGYVLTMGNSTSVVPSPRGCARHHHGLQCYYGARAIRNTVVLQEQLTADIYNRTDAQFVLWIIRRRAQHNINRVCAPVQLKIQLHPLPEQETFINCEVDPLPPSFNAPGLYNNVTGVLRFTGDVLVNLTTREQKALLQTSKKRSLLRAWVANHDEIDVDIMLYDMSNKRMLAASMAMTGPEGLVYELLPNVTYGIALAVLSGYRRYSPRDHDFVEFCDSFQLQVHVFPISSSVSDDAGSGCGERGPDLGGVPQQLNTTGTVNFGLTDTATPPFSFPIDTATVAGQKAINGKAGFRFYLKKASFFFALMNADTYGGTPQMVLTRDRSADTLYSTPRTVGSSIYGQLEPGWYNLKFVTPYVQSTSKTWSEISSAIPTCIRYNFKLRISPTRGCLQPLLIPAELPNTPHGHHHLFDEYRIPDSGTASVSLPSTGVTSTLHVQVQESDAPATIVLYSGDISDGSQTEIARSHRIVPSNAMDSIQLFTNLDAQTSYTLTFTFDLQAGIPTSCRTMQMQLALNPMPDAPTKKCPTPQGTIDLGAIAPPFDSNDARMIRAASRPLDRRPIVFTFNLTTTSHFRYIMDFDFNIHATGVQLCPCPEPTQCGDLCTVGYMYFNGVEIPRQTLSPGVYSVAIFPTTASMTTGRDLEHDCSLLGVRFVLAPIAARKPPSMCPRRMQYLPSSLNTVGILSRYYNREAHFLQLVRVNEQHYIDESTFVLTDRSILRVSIPGNGYTASVRVLSADRQRSFGSGAMHTTVVALDPGQYILVVTFSVRWNNFRGDECLAVPLELGIIKAQDVPKLAEAPPGGDVDSCESPYPLPTTMTNHGHRTMYRKVDPTNQFHHTINFTVGSTGAYVEADLRYNFQVAGLGIRLQRADASNPKAVTFGYYADRSYFGKDLPPGDYQLEVYDPVWAYPTNMPFVNCTPWSLHLRQWDAAAPLPSVSLAPGGPVVTATPRPTHRPMLDCPYYSYNTLPRTLDRSTDASSRWFSVRGRHYEIPFANGVVFASGMPNRPLYITYKRTSLVAFPGDVVRVWASSSAAVTIRLRLYQDNGTKPVDQGLEFGHRTVSLAYRPVILGTSAHMSVEVSFVYTQAPEYPRDYTTCWNKEALTSFELYLAVFPRSRISDAASCDFVSSQTPSPVTAAPAHTQLAPADYTGSYPPASVTLDKPLRIEARTYYFSRSDCKKQRPSAWSNSPAPHTISTMWASTTCSYIMNVTVPPASMGVFFSAELKYSMLLSDMRSTLYYKNGSVVKTSRGGPAADGDERYNAETDVHAWGLAPGDYMYIIEQSFASLKTVSQLAEVCVPFELDLNLGGSVLGSVTEAPSMQGARVIQVMPNSIGHVDPAQPFRITMNVDQPLDVDFRPRGVYPIALLDKVSGTIVKPSGRYFASRTSVVTTYNAGTLKWLWPYDVVIDTTAFRTKDGQLPYNIAVGTLPSHRTSSCSCDQGVCSEGGACACHEAGQNCQRCPNEMRLTPSRVQLGPAGTIWPTKMARVCQYHDDPGDVPPATPSTATPPQTSQPQPVPVSPDASPSPPDVPVGPTPPTDAPVVDGSGVVVTDTPSPDSKRPPFKFMRVVMSASALMLMAIFAGFRLVNWGHRRRHAQNFHNPFRRVAQNEDAADDQDDDPADPGTSTLPPASRPAATIVPDTRRKARHAVNADDDFSENDAIVH